MAEQKFVLDKNLKKGRVYSDIRHKVVQTLKPTAFRYLGVMTEPSGRKFRAFELLTPNVDNYQTRLVDGKELVCFSHYTKDGGLYTLGERGLKKLLLDYEN